MIKPPLPEPTWREWLLWLLRRRTRRRVTGHSMTPTLQPGDLVLADPRAYRSQLPRDDDIVLARDPRAPDNLIIKRVGVVEPDGRVYLLSDNPREGTDSRVFGSVARGAIVGRVTARIPAPST